MKFVIPVLTVVYAAIAVVFGIGSLALLGLATMALWEAVAPGNGATLAARAATAIESIGLITVSAHVAGDGADGGRGRSGPSGARQRADARTRYLSRFLVVVVVALAIESLVGVVEALRCDPVFVMQRIRRDRCRGLLTARPWFVRFSRGRGTRAAGPQASAPRRRQDPRINAFLSRTPSSIATQLPRDQPWPSYSPRTTPSMTASNNLELTVCDRRGTGARAEPSLRKLPVIERRHE